MPKMPDMMIPPNFMGGPPMPPPFMNQKNGGRVLSQLPFPGPPPQMPPNMFGMPPHGLPVPPPMMIPPPMSMPMPPMPMPMPVHGGTQRKSCLIFLDFFLCTCRRSYNSSYIHFSDILFCLLFGKEKKI